MATRTLTHASKAAARATQAQAARDDAIRAAKADGATLRAIAAATGLSHQRIYQIVQAQR